MEGSRPTWGHLAGGWAPGSDALDRGGLDGPRDAWSASARFVTLPGSSSRPAGAPCWHGLGLLPTALAGDTGWGDGHSEALTALRKARPRWAHKVPFVPAWATLPKSARAARRAGEPWVTGGKQSPADCPYRPGSDKAAGWEELAVVTAEALPPAPTAA